MESSLWGQKVSNKRGEEKHIDQKVQSEQISPTADEMRIVDDIREKISVMFKDELTSKEKIKNRTPEQQRELNERLEKAIKEEVSNLSIKNHEKSERIKVAAIANIVGLGPIQQYLDNDEVTEIVVQRFDNIAIELKGQVYSTTAAFMSEDNLKNVINRILQPVGREVSISTPIVDAHLLDGSRICATIPPASPRGSTLTIRKFNNDMMTAQKYLELNSISKEMLAFLSLCVVGKVSIFVSGGTGTGKTTFLNMLSSFLPEKELIITIEDTLELQLKQPNVRSLETRPIQDGNSGTMQSIDMAALVKASLRMRPDRIIVGETRDGAVVSLLNAMSTGHEGSMSTGHANSPENLVRVRIPTMMEMDRSTSFTERAQAMMISEALQLIVQLRRLPNSGRRVVSQICSVEGLDDQNRVQIMDIYRYDIDKDTFYYTGNYPQRIIDHMAYYGVGVPKWMFPDPEDAKEG